MSTENLKIYQNPYRFLDYEMKNYDGHYTTKSVSFLFLSYVKRICKQNGYKLVKDYMILNNLNTVIFWLYISKINSQYIINVYNNDWEKEFVFSEAELLCLIRRKEIIE